MITIIQVDRNYKQNSNYYLLSKNIERMDKNDNMYKIYIDDNDFNKEDGGAYTRLKIIKLLEILKEYDDEEIIMYIDAFDTIVVADDVEIERKFLSFDIDVLYSCERCCWSSENFRKYFSDNSFVNSGTIIFKNKKYQEILEILSLIHLRSNICDQYYHTLFVTINSMDIKIKLDKSNDIFQCLWGYDSGLFYFAQTCAEAQKFDKAIEYYEKRIKFDTISNNEEVYISLFKLAQIKAHLGYYNDAMNIYLQCHEENPNRLEHIAQIIQYYNSIEQYNIAYIYSSYAMKFAGKLPNNSYVLLDHSVYIWKIYDLHNISCWWSGRIDEAKETFKLLWKQVENGLVDENDIERITYNKQFNMD